MTTTRRSHTMKTYRHGDILIRQIEKAPGGLTAVDRVNGRLILAEGEVTGHAHAIADTEVELLELVTPGDAEEMRQRFLRVEQEVALTHEEHATIMLPPGDYEVIRQVEYTPTQLARVAD